MSPSRHSSVMEVQSSLVKRRRGAYLVALIACAFIPQIVFGQSTEGPDLKVYAISTLTSPWGIFPGSSVQLSAGIQNAGDESSAATTVRYYRSTDSTITTSDTEEGSDELSALDPEETISIGETLTVPAEAGTYYYGVCVDSVTDESDTTNNCSGSLAVEVLERTTTPSDLQVGSPTVSDSSLETGASFTLSATVSNAGDGASASTTLRYYRSTDTTITTSDTQVGTDSVGALSASATSSESVDLTAPSSAGTYYYGACVDSVSDESDTANNCSSSVSVVVSEPADGPDLKVPFILVVTSPWGTPPGGSIQFNASVENVGDAESAATTLRYYRSTDATITTSDTEVGTDSIGALSASESSATQAIDLTAPSTVGTYYYGACVDSVTDESDTTNNCSSSLSVVVSEPADEPDLVVNTPTVDDSSPRTGASFTLSATVRNAGDESSVATTLRYYRSTDATITTSDTEVGTDSIGALSASESSATQAIDLTAPSTVGTYYYGACVDSVTDESDTTNNCSSSVSVVVSEPAEGPDLKVYAIVRSSGTPGVFVGSSIRLTAGVRNGGDESSAATTVRYYRSTDSTITTSDTEEGSVELSALDPAETISVGERLTVPATAGTYYYGACVDSVTDESDTTNNCSGSLAVEVLERTTTPSDLQVGSPTVSDSSLETGASFTLSATVRNDGDEQSAASTLRYYRSTDSTISASDTQVGTDTVGTLAASGTSAGSISLTAPSSAGTYYYGACVDTVTGESDITNNCSSSVTIAVEEESSGQPDLRIDVLFAVTPLDGVFPGTRIQFQVGVQNDGDANSDATTLRYYRSTDATISASDTEVGTDEVSALVPSGRVTGSINLTAPSQAGTYYYGACVEAVADESDTTNNCSRPFSVEVFERTTTPSDLQVGSPSVSDSSLETGASFTLSATVSNAGAGASAFTTLRYYRSTDATITTSDTEVGTDSIGALSASESSATQAIDLTAPSTVGTYYYGACVDSVTDESDTTNNCSSSLSVVVSEPADEPDLVVNTPTVDDSSPRTGASFTLSATVRNAGDESSVATTLRYYRSTDATITTSDTEVGTDSIGALSASESSATQAIDLTAPSTVGTYYYGACVDSVTDESDTTNNCSSSVSVVVSEPAEGPDLKVYAIVRSSGTPGVFVGSSIRLTAGVRNGGDESSAATTVRYYRSTDSTITTSDTEEGSVELSALDPAETISVGERLTVPATAGTYYYGACVDSVTDESDTTNNCSGSLAVEVLERTTTPSDLQVGSPTVSDSSLETGASFTLSATVRNAGDGASAATTLRYYRSTDATITASDTSVGTDAVGTLAASGTSAESISVTAPSDAGTYYYGACVDSVTDESDTTNNCSSSVSVVVSEPADGPDLVVNTPSVDDSSLETGASFTLSATVRNAGDESSVATTLRYYRSTDATISASDTSVGTDAVGTLAASGTSAESISVTAPSDAGTYYYGACVDSVTGESSTANNCSGSVTVTVEAPAQYPDLEVGTPTVSDSSPETGESFTLSATVRNAGDGASAATTLRYYRSTDATITASDTSVGTDAVGTLAASGTSAESISVTAPSDAGTYYYGACVDSVTDESDTTNNCSSSVSVVVSEPADGPDLVVNTPSVDDSSLETGASFTLSATVRNDGDEQSAASTLRYYRSTDSTISASDTQVGTDTVGTLAASGTSAGSISLTAPSSAGTYYYGACVDTVTGESDITNNCSSSVTIAVEEESSGQPDLRIDVLFAVTPLDGVFPGTRIQFQAGVQNDGDANSDATTLRYYRSTDATISASDTEVGTDEVSALVPSGRGYGEYQPDRAVAGGHVLLRRVRGGGGRRVRHDQQLLAVVFGGGVRADDDTLGPPGGLAVGERQQSGDGCVVHAVGDGEQRRGRGRRHSRPCGITVLRMRRSRRRTRRWGRTR